MGWFDVEDEDPLLRKIKKWNDERKLKKTQEEAIRKDVFNKNYGSIYAEEYKKKLQRETKQKFAPRQSGGIFGGGTVRSKLKSSGFLQPDTKAINNVLYGDFFNPTGVKRNQQQRVTHHHPKGHEQHKKKIVIYT